MIQFQLIGNNIQLILDAKSVQAKNPSIKDDLVKELQKYIPRNRLSGLIRNTYKISVDELVIVCKILDVKADDVLNVQNEEVTA